MHYKKISLFLLFYPANQVNNLYYISPLKNPRNFTPCYFTFSINEDVQLRELGKNCRAHFHNNTTVFKIKIRAFFFWKSKKEGDAIKSY